MAIIPTRKFERDMSGIFHKRIEAVRSNLDIWRVDGLLVTNLINCAWLSGFRGSFAALLITTDRAVLATDSRYWEQAAIQATSFELFRHSRQLEETAELILSSGIKTVGTEANHITVQEARELESIAEISWRHLDRPVEPLRRRKTAEEVHAIRAAAAITDAAMAILSTFLYGGITELQLAWRLEQFMRDSGASAMAFPPIVAFGPNSALPHHAPGGRKLQYGDIVLVDMGARLDGYNSDLTRTFIYGETLNSRFEEVYGAVLEAQEAAINAVRPGTDSREAHMLAENYIAKAGYGDAFKHGLGHGLGLELHEDPFLSARRPPQELEQDMVITIEPGIYLPGWGGVRIEDLILVTGSGSQYISLSPKQRLIAAS